MNRRTESTTTRVSHHVKLSDAHTVGSIQIGFVFRNGSLFCATACSVSVTDNGFILPRRAAGIICPGFISNVLIGAFAAFASWTSYGSGGGVELARNASAGSPRAEISLTFSALAGAFLVGVAGARWITNEADKRLLKESVTLAADKAIPAKDCEKLMQCSPRRAFEALQKSLGGELASMTHPQRT
jgi:hypothetical protein